MIPGGLPARWSDAPQSNSHFGPRREIPANAKKYGAATSTRGSSPCLTRRAAERTLIGRTLMEEYGANTRVRGGSPRYRGVGRNALGIRREVTSGTVKTIA
jgi:hypothetical protein